MLENVKYVFLGHEKKPETHEWT